MEEAGNTRPSRFRSAAYAVFALALVFAASAVGGMATYENLSPWYQNLVKPDFTPPSWIFGPVWTGLFLLMAFGFWRVLTRQGGAPVRSWAIRFFLAQLALNATWSWMFFAAHSPLLGLINIVPQTLAVFATIVLFFQVDRAAGWALLPLGLWVSFATILNYEIWILNR